MRKGLSLYNFRTNTTLYLIGTYHFGGIHRVYVPKKTDKSIVFVNNRDIVSFVESCCGKGTSIENETIREATKKNPKKNRTAALSKLDKSLPCLVFVCALFYFVFHYKSLASTDVTTNLPNANSYNHDNLQDEE